MKNRLYTKLLLSVAVALVIVPASVFGQDHDHHDHTAHADSGSRFYGHLDVRIHLDNIIDAEEADEEFNEVYSHSHIELGARLGNGFSINTNIKLEGEPSGHSHGHGGEEDEHEGEEDEHEGEEDEHEGEEDSGDRFFEDHPLLIEQLTLNYDNDKFSAYVGKFNPIVGFDYHNFPGIYGYQTVEGYIIRERIGLGIALKHNAGDYGKHRLDISTFFADTTVLSNSILYKRGRTSKEDGGLSNTEDFSSFAISLGGSDFYSLSNNIVEGLSYRIGYAKQAAGIDNEDDETRYSVSLGYKHRITQDLSAKFLAEYVDINHFGGEASHDRTYSTTALRLNYQQWNLGTSYNYIDNDAEEEDENHDGDVFQISVGYLFGNGIGLDLGYQRSDEENEVTERIGAMISYSYQF